MRARCDGPSWRRLAGVIFVLMLVPAPNAAATFPGANGGLTVAWSSGDCSRRLVTMSLDGRGSRALTPCARVYGVPLVDAPDWSPDGRRLVFVKDFEVAVMAADGSHQRTLQLGGNFSSVSPDPSFAPDGKRLTFVADDRSGHRAIWVATLRGRTIRRLRGGAEPRWSPDGRVIAFRTVDGVFLMRARTGALLRRVAPPSAAAYDWSPDGRRLVYAATGPEFSREIFSVRTDRPGRPPRQLTHSRIHEDEPVWSPDGRWIAFVREHPISESVVYSIWTMTANGTHRRQVFRSTPRDSEETLPPRLAWRPRTVVTPSARAAALTDAGYLAFADRVAERLDRTWDARDGRYVMGNRGLDAIYNAALLTVHATAALHGHVGPARNDARAVRLAERLMESPPFFTGPAVPVPDSMFHSPGWTGTMVGEFGAMDKAIDPKVAEALALTWRARDVLALAPETAARISEAITSVAHGPFFRFPYVRLNQINWSAELYAYAAEVTGDAQLLRDDYGRHVQRFLAGVRRPWFAPSPDAATNLSPSLRFHYKPDQTPRSGTNLDSAEYANITLHFIAEHQAARAAGMLAFSADDRRLLRAWVRRVLFGYWTHSGMLNWDTGLGLRRWMKGKTWAYAQQGLLAIAASPAFHDDPRQRAWAKALFDHGLRLYERLDALGPHLDELPHPALMDVEPARQSASDARIFAARMAANAARAVNMELGRMPDEEPPAFYSFDPDIGRLAVSTPVYSTAVVPVNRGAFAYGGIELARLLDREGAPLTGVGGTAPSAPGIQVHDASDRLVLASQVGMTDDPRRPPLTLTRSPEGPVTRMDAAPGSVHAGPFRTLEAVGRRRSRDLVLTTRHRFSDRAIEETWRVERRAGRRWYRASVVLPSSGSQSTVEAIMRDGRVTELVPGAASVALRSVTRFRVQSQHGAYTVAPLAAGRGRARAIAMQPQTTAPTPGPALELVLAAGRRFDRRELRAQIVPCSAWCAQKERVTSLLGG